MKGAAITRATAKSNKGCKTIVLYCAHLASLDDYRLLADELQQRSSAHVRLYGEPGMRLNAEGRGRQAEFCETPFADEKHADAVLPLGGKVAERLFRVVDLAVRGRLATFWQTWRQIAVRRIVWQALLSDLRPSVVVVTDDRRPVASLSLLAACREAGIPALVFGSAVIGSPEELIANRRFKPQNHAAGGWRACLARLLPTGFGIPKGRNALFFDLQQALALRLHGIKPVNPWVMGGSGLVAHVAVQGEMERALCLGEFGLAKEQVTVVGSPSLDWLSAEASGDAEDEVAALYARHGLDADRPLAVFSVPQHFSDAPPYTDGDLAAIVRSLVRAGFAVICSLHPKTAPASRQFLGEIEHCALAAEPLSRIFHRATLFLASYSSTLTWAGLRAIPCGVLDFHDENLSTYREVEGLAFLHGTEEVERWARGLTDPAERRRTGDTLRIGFERYQAPPGQATNKLAALVLSLAQAPALAQ